MLSIKGNEKIHMWIFLAMPFLYFLLHAFWGYDNTDQGFIQGLSWRILNGELIYIDFDYVRPPLTPYLHALEMAILPTWGAVLWSRLVFYLMMAGSVWFAMAAINQRVALRMFSTYAWLMACFGFILSVHNYPAMPWHTVDGIFFASLGIFLISKSKAWWMISLGMLACLLAALTKQSFYPVPMIGVLAAFVFWDWKKSLIALGSGLVFGGIILGMMLAFGIWDAFILQTTGSSSFMDLFQAGVMSYAKPMLVTIPLMMMPLLWNKLYKGAKWKNIGGWMFWIGIVMLWLINLYRSFSQGITTGTHLGWTQGIFIIGMMAGIYSWLKMGKSFFILPALSMVAWCAGISWGMQTPVLFITAPLVGVVAFNWMMGGFLPPKWFYPALIVVAAVIFNLLYLFPYRSDSVWNCTETIGDEFPALSGIMVDEATAEKHRELANLSLLYPGEMTVLPSFPSAAWLLNRKASFRSEWAHNGEMVLKDDPSATEYYKQLPDYVFIEKGKEEEIQKEGKYGSIIASQVMKNAAQIDEGKYFLIFYPRESK